MQVEFALVVGYRLRVVLKLQLCFTGGLVGTKVGFPVAKEAAEFRHCNFIDQFQVTLFAQELPDSPECIIGPLPVDISPFCWIQTLSGDTGLR